MEKLIDFDGMFDRELLRYMSKNKKKYTEEEWEDAIPKLYRKFGDTYIASAGNTPAGYYAAMTDEALTETFRRHVAEGVPVSGFLQSELEKRDCPAALLALIREGDPALLAAALPSAGEGEALLPVLFSLLERELPEETAQLIEEKLSRYGDRAKEGEIALYRAGIRKQTMLDLLSRTEEKDDRVLEILLREFRTAHDDLPVLAGYLAAYGDERALPVLEEFIKGEINYLEYREVGYAIEALGGEYEPRSFENDPYYLEIKAKSEQLQAPSEGNK